MAYEILQALEDEVSLIIRDDSYETAGTAAQGTITLTGLPSADETITIHDQTFTFKALRSTTGEITIGADADACVANIETAIDTDLDIVSATANTTTDTVVVTAFDTGTAYNNLVFTDSASNLTMDGSGTLGGTTAGVNGDYIKKFFNECLQLIASKFFLPELKESSTVATSTTLSYVNMPTNYHKSLFYCYSNTNNKKIKVYKNVVDLLRQFNTLDMTGRVIGVAVRGQVLHYQCIPSSAETLRIDYYKQPDMLVNATDQPTCLPEHLAKHILVNYACWKIFGQIEDGVDGPQQNTVYYKQLFDATMEDLTLFYGDEATHINKTSGRLVKPN